MLVATVGVAEDVAAKELNSNINYRSLLHFII